MQSVNLSVTGLFIASNPLEAVAQLLYEGDLTRLLIIPLEAFWLI